MRRSPPHGGADRNNKSQSALSGAGRVAPSRGRGSKLSRRGPTDCRRRVAPSRGRGSKLTGDGIGYCGRSAVAPSRGRGSKQSSIAGLDPAGRAVAPSRGRGSKPAWHAQEYRHVAVGRPLTGARIETMPEAGPQTNRRTSPPHGGADRNMHPATERDRRRRVAPSRGRGSKQQHDGASVRAAGSRPLTGARIETTTGAVGTTKHAGRPLTGARIETNHQRGLAPSRQGSPPHGGADRNWGNHVCWHASGGRPLTGARIETPPKPDRQPRRHVAPSRGRGSKHVETMAHLGSPSRPLTGARIETPSVSGSDPTNPVAPSRGRGSKRHRHGLDPRARLSPPHGGADRGNS